MYNHSKYNGIAFFDVDETVINVKSMFDFLHFLLKKKHKFSGNFLYLIIWQFFKTLSVLGVNRNKINLLYYQLFTGTNYNDLIQYGLDWYNFKKNQDNFLINPVVTHLKTLKQRGYMIVFVSGSFRPCLNPIAKDLGAESVICAELEIKNNNVTGKLTQQAIGVYKAKLVKQFMGEHNISSKDCYAFGDHISDLKMLEIVGHPYVVSNCEKLNRIAETNNWHIISAIN